MIRLANRKPRVLVLMIVAVILGGGVAAILWAKTRRVPDLVAQADAAYSRRDWARADQLARKRLKQAPDDPKALQLAARAAAQQDRDAMAIAIYSRLFLEAVDAEDLFLLGRALSRTGQIDAAFKSYERARLADPDHPATLDALAQLYLRNDRENAAEEAAERLVRQPGWEARGLLLLGAARAELHDPNGAVQALRRFFQLDPEGRAAAPSPVRTFRLLLARSLLRSRQPAEARRLLQDLLAREPDAEAAWLLGRCYIQEQDWGRAATMLQPGASFRAEHPLESEPAPYVGAARCAGCHREIYRSLIATKHATTFSRARELDTLVLPPHPLPDPGNPQVTHDFMRRDGSLQIETRAGEQAQRAVIDYAFGSRDHFMTFAGRDDRGRSRMLRISHYESPRGSGWDLSTGLPPRPENPQDYLGNTMLEGDGVRRCLSCHTTNFRAVLDQSGPESADAAIGCEKCHGPGGHHVAAADARFSDLAIVNPGRLPGPAIDQTCGQCHNLHDTGVISAPRTDPAWYRFQSLALTWSRCYTESEGTLSCVTCHDPHTNGKTSAARQEANCLSCHGADPVPASTAHAPPSVPSSRQEALVPVRRRAGGGRVKENPGPSTLSPETPSTRDVRTTCPIDPAKGCIACHMPSAWQQSTHSFKTDHFIRVRDRQPSEK
jgi:cytochrome c-type biogenesis protein CcmH/NrfG